MLLSLIDQLTPYFTLSQLPSTQLLQSIQLHLSQYSNCLELYCIHFTFIYSIYHSHKSSNALLIFCVSSVNELFYCIKFLLTQRDISQNMLLVITDESSLDHYSDKVSSRKHLKVSLKFLQVWFFETSRTLTTLAILCMSSFLFFVWIAPGNYQSRYQKLVLEYTANI